MTRRNKRLKNRTRGRDSKRNCRGRTDSKRNCRGRRYSRTKKGGYGKGSCPFVGETWNALGPPSNPYVPKPWYQSNNGNYYAYNTSGTRVGGITPYPGDKLYKNIKGGSKIKHRTRKSKYLGLKGGGISFSDFIPNLALNIIRPIKTAFLNNSPLIGKRWRGLPKDVSPLPTEQPKLKPTQNNNMANNNSKPLNIKKIQQNAENYVKNLSK